MAFEIQSVRRGDSFLLSFSGLTDEFGVAATTLASWEFYFALKSSRDETDSAALIKASTADMVVNNDAVSVSLTLTPAQLSILEEGVVYFYAFKAQSPGGFVTTLVDEVLSIEPSSLTTI